MSPFCDWNLASAFTYYIEREVHAVSKSTVKGLESGRMVLHVGDRVFWGAPEVIYLEGVIVSLHPESQTAVVHVDRTTPYSAHLIGTDVPFTADGVTPLQGKSPPGTTDQRSSE